MKKVVAGMCMTAAITVAALSMQSTQTQAAVTGKLNNKQATIAVGGNVKLKVTGAGKAKISFVSGKKKIASVNTKGVVKGLKKGKTKITAIVKKGNKKKKLTCSLTVIQGAKTLRVQDASGNRVEKVTLTKYDSISLQAKMTPAKCGDEVKWKSADTDIATVKNGVITGQYVGTTTVTATTISGKKVKVKVSVKAPELKTPLKEAYADDFKIGAAVNTWQLVGNGGYAKAKPLIVFIS